jgi:farnesyl-diphosphate farnesyltransferase
MSGVGEGAERELLEGFGAVSRVFNRLPKSSQDVIRDITIQMGDGMADFVSVDMGQGTVSCEAYARYCHMVAGLVGEGLSLIFVGRGMETEACLGQGVFVWPFCKAPADKPANTLGIANSMGLFLQKTNILRDYLEDYVDNRAFWPQDVWKKFARTNDLGEFARPTAHGRRRTGRRTACSTCPSLRISSALRFASACALICASICGRPRHHTA